MNMKENNEKATFKSYLNELIVETDEFQSMIEKSQDNAGKKRIALILSSLYLKKIKVEYSMEISKKVIKEDVNKFVSCVSLADDILPISYKIDTLSLGYLFNLKGITREVFLSRALELISLNDSTESPSEVFSKLGSFLKAKPKERDFASFMNQEWYSLCSDFAWYNLKERKDFEGYFSFFATAIAKYYSFNVTDVQYIASSLI